MSHLSKYVESILYPETANTHAIQSARSRVKIWTEDNIEVSQEITTYYFDNGAVIKRILEQDHERINIEACHEQWIMYLVVTQNEKLPTITPRRIQFNSTCRELFWLKYFEDHVAHPSQLS